MLAANFCSFRSRYLFFLLQIIAVGCKDKYVLVLGNENFDQPFVTLPDTNYNCQIPVKFVDSGLSVMDVSFVIISKANNIRSIYCVFAVYDTVAMTKSLGLLYKHLIQS